MVKQINPAELTRLAQKDIFQRVADGDWYQFSHEPAMQAIVNHSTQMLQQINDLAKTDIEQANAYLTKFLPHSGQDVTLLYPITRIEHPNTLFIGDHTFINANFFVLSAGKVTIGQHCFIGPDCRLYTPNHTTNRRLRQAGWQYDQPITIGNDCWFGGSVIVLPGVTIGDNVIVGAGSVVTHDLPSNVVAAGNPARIIRDNPAE